MKVMRLGPSRLRGTVVLPPSKSMAHRALLGAALTDGVSHITNIAFSDDIRATMQGLTALGAVFTPEPDGVRVAGIFSAEAQAERQDCVRTLDCNESGSTVRFLIPVALALPETATCPTRFIGRGQLGKRPLGTYFSIFDRLGITYTKGEDNLPLTIQGQLVPGCYELPGDISSQFITGLLYALPLLTGDSTIVVTTPLESRAYIDLTLAAMRAFGVTVTVTEQPLLTYTIRGGQRYQPCTYCVEADDSQAAFFLVANALGNEVTLKGLEPHSQQGDREAMYILERMGLRSTFTPNGVVCDSSNVLRATSMSGAQCPDAIPVLSLAAALAQGTSYVQEAGRLRIKECDRLAAVYQELTRLGAHMVEEPEGLVVTGLGDARPGRFSGDVTVWSHKDHRIAMTLAIAATCCDQPIFLRDWACVSKSYPDFFTVYRALGGDAVEWDLGT